MEWQDIKTAPKANNYHCLGYWQTDDMITNIMILDTMFYDDGRWYDTHTDLTINPTHWMPLPPVPQN